MQVFEVPFRHAVIEDFLQPDIVRQINEEWPQQWSRKTSRTSIKWDTQDLPPAARKVVDEFDIGIVETATGIKGLIPDPDLFGAGLHSIPAGGFLKMHVDFNRHPKGWHRRVNVLIYLNETWDPLWGGDLTLMSAEPLGGFKLIEPRGGRCVIFETNDKSWHGHPDKLKCPENVQRRSLALYFYTQDPPSDAAHTTIYWGKK